ncbi:MAG: zinc ribbon domain-containing protein, partial [Candidatus Methylomirabilis sp.]|nr:zinc ribbon domain-containing protein [Candidatus Methylomirabilis sp.]
MSDAPEDRLVCPNCQHENKSDAHTCVECGNSLVITVPVPPSAPEQNALVKAEIKPDAGPGLLPNTVTLLIA